jgi:hypothetical protein
VGLSAFLTFGPRLTVSLPCLWCKMGIRFGLAPVDMLMGKQADSGGIASLFISGKERGEKRKNPNFATHLGLNFAIFVC